MGEPLGPSLPCVSSVSLDYILHSCPQYRFCTVLILACKPKEASENQPAWLPWVSTTPLPLIKARDAGPQGFNGQNRQDLSLVALLDLSTCCLTLHFCTVKFLPGPSKAPRG